MDDAHLRAPLALHSAQTALQPVLGAKLVEDGAADTRPQIPLLLVRIVPA